jgi:hypothetical protein
MWAMADRLDLWLGGALRTGSLSIAACAALGITPGGALCQDPTPHAWRLEITPYAWAAGWSGTVRVADVPQIGLGIRQSFGDVWKVLDYAVSGSVEVGRDRWGGLLDVTYVDVSDEGTVAGALGFNVLAGNGSASQQTYALAATYRAVEGESPVDLLAGLRLNSIRWDIDVLLSVPVLPALDRRLSEDQRWVDPFLGARLRQPIHEKASLVGYLDVGGFGIGSRLAWRGMVEAEYAFNRALAGKLGYRYLSIDHESDGLVWDLASGGVSLGLGLRW